MCGIAVDSSTPTPIMHDLQLAFHYLYRIGCVLKLAHGSLLTGVGTNAIKWHALGESKQLVG